MADNADAVGATGSEVHGILQYTMGARATQHCSNLQAAEGKTGTAELKGSRNACNVFKTAYYRLFPNL